MPYFSLKERRSSSSSCSSDDSYEQLMSQQAYWGSQRVSISSSATSPDGTPSPSLVPANPNLYSATKTLDFSNKECVKETTAAPLSTGKDTAAPLSTGKELPIYSIEGPDKEVQPQPDWHELLFGGKENNCAENLAVPEVDTYYEDCKLAEDVALNLLNNYHLPVANGFRELNTNKVTSALRSLSKCKKIQEEFDAKEKVLAYIVILDYLACCCQDGNLLPLYQKCKDSKKQYHFDLIHCDLGSVLGSMKQGCYSAVQINSAEKLLKASLERIQRQFNATYIKNSILRKVFVLKSEDETGSRQKQLSESKYEPKAKKMKTTVATSKNWVESFSESSPSTKKRTPKVLHSTPSKFDGTRDWTFTSPSKPPEETVTSKHESCGLTASSKLVHSSRFIDTLFEPDDSDKASDSSSLEESKSSSLSNQTSEEKFSSDTFPGYGKYDDLSDDDLPDIPLNIPKATVLNSTDKSHKTNGSFMLYVDSNKNTNKPNQCSPYKSSANTWKFSKYESPTKFLPPRSPMKEVVAKYTPREKQLGRSPLKLAKNQPENISPYVRSDSYAAQENSSDFSLKKNLQQKRHTTSKVCLKLKLPKSGKTSF